MKLMLTAAAAALSLAGTAASAQTVATTPVPVMGPNQTLLNVTANGQSRRRPDLAVFSAGVVTQGKNAGEAMAANAQRMDQVIAALRRAGVADRDIQTQSLSLQPQYWHPEQDREIERRARELARARGDTTVPEITPRQPEAPRIIGYEARNQVTVRVRKLDQMGRIIDTLAGAGANQIDGPSFALDEPEAATDEARAEAMRVARQRAELYARSAGLRVARIVSISESGGYYPVAQEIIVTGARVGAPPPPPPSPVLPGELALGVSLSVQFALEP